MDEYVVTLDIKGPLHGIHVYIYIYYTYIYIYILYTHIYIYITYIYIYIIHIYVYDSMVTNWLIWRINQFVFRIVRMVPGIPNMQ